VISSSHDHPDVEELHRAAARSIRHLDRDGVPDSRLFEEAGILERHDFRDGRSRYEEMQNRTTITCRYESRQGDRVRRSKSSDCSTRSPGASAASLSITGRLRRQRGKAKAKR
jgi:hypothetical protein